MRSQRGKTVVVVVVCILMMVVVGTLLVLRLPHRQQLQVKKQKSPTTQLQAADVSAPGLVTGVLKTAQGQPLPGAVVYLSTARVTVPVYSDPSAKVQSTVTGPDGRFAFSEETANRAVIVINEKGYGQATVADLAKTQELVLQAWAHVEGTLRQGK